MHSDRKGPEDVFKCRRCGDCCRGYGGTYLTSEDIEAIAAYLGTGTESLLSSYCRLSGDKYLLAQRADGYCVFWDRLCTIHPVKPRMCRNWPFIESVLKDVGNWRAMATMCPGIRTEVSDEEVIRRVKEALETDGQ
jgi:Fe-S-cluster containining protein